MACMFVSLTLSTHTFELRLELLVEAIVLSIFQWVTEVKVLKWAVFTAFLFFYCVKAKEEVAMVDSQRDAFMFI